MSPKICLRLIGLAILGTSAFAQTTRVVPSQYPTIQSAIVAAVNGDTVLVQPGVYAENVDFLNREIVVRSTAGAASTTIDGSQTGTVVVIMGGQTNATVLEGFTLSNGFGSTTAGQSPAAPGGLLCLLASPTIRDCVITGNQGGGGSSTPTLASTNNTAVYGNGGAGGMAIIEGAPILERTRIIGNSGGPGAAAVCPTVPLSNIPTIVRGGIGGPGGLLVLGPTAIVVAREVVIESNLGGQGGMAACPMYGVFPESGRGGAGGAALDVSQPSQFVRTKFVSNVGGGSGVMITSPWISGGPSGQSGSGGAGGLSLRVFSAFPPPAITLASSVVVNNTGGQAYQIGNNSVDGCGGIEAASTALLLDHATIAGNVAGGLRVTSVTSLIPNSVFRNAIVWGNVGTQIAGANNFFTQYLNCVTPGFPTIPTNGSFNADPQFLDLPNGDVRLGPFSPCRNAGSAAVVSPLLLFDLDGDPRRVETLPDIGADEYDDLQGTREDLMISVQVNGIEPNSVPVASIASGQTLTVAIASPGGFYAATAAALAGETGGVPFVPNPIGVFPEVHLSYAATVVATIPAIGAGASLFAIIPPGMSGITVRLQAFAVSPAARNAFFSATAARDLVFL